MKKSRLAKASEGEDGLDMISNLLDDILQSILSQIPTTEEAIRTSILSRRWRYLWTLVPSVDIDYARRLNPSQEFDSNGFREFVNWVLQNKPLYLDSFCLRCSDYYNMSTVGTWIDAAVTKKVKVVDLMFCPPEWSEEIELPDCLVTCGSLEVLKLCLIGDPLTSPKFTGFLALKVLELNEVELDYDDYNVLNYFLESCPLLEDLSLIDCRADSLIISSPKLKNLRIHARESVDNLEICCENLEILMLRGHVAWEYVFESLYSLKKAVIHTDDIFEVNLDFFAGISHVDYLSCNVWCINEWFDSEVDAPISLPNLKTLEIIIDVINMDALILFLKYLPDLESFHLIFPEEVNWHNYRKLDDAEMMRVLTRYLKKVEFLGFDEEGPNQYCENPKLDVARALLKHGNLLEEMVFSWENEARFHERSMETMKEVSNFHKASSIVKLTTVFNPTQVN